MTTPIANYVRRGKVTRVVDGDSIDIDIYFGFHLFQVHRVRLLRVDTPELNSPDAGLRAKAIEAKTFVNNAIMEREIILETVKSDSFGRYLAEVYYTDSDGTEHNLSDELLANGLATPFKPRQIEREQLPRFKPEPLPNGKPKRVRKK